MAERGRPRKFQSVQDLQEKIDAYFAHCDSRKKKVVVKKGKFNEIVEINDPIPYTVSGMAVFLDTTRETFMDYESGKYDDDNNKYSDTIKKAKFRCLADAEERLVSKDEFTPGIIFSMKNNYGWTDKQEITAEIEVKRKLEDFIK